MLYDFGQVAMACEEWGMPLVAMVYTRGAKVSNEYDLEVAKHAARVGAELGAEIVKVVYTGAAESFRQVVEGAGATLPAASRSSSPAARRWRRTLEVDGRRGHGGRRRGRLDRPQRLPAPARREHGRRGRRDRPGRPRQWTRPSGTGGLMSTQSKTVWVRVVPWNKDLVTAALEAGADAVLVEAGRTADVKALGLIPTVAPDGDLKLGADVVEVEIQGKADEQRALELSQAQRVIVHARLDGGIPLENIIAGGGHVIAGHNAAEALTAVQKPRARWRGAAGDTRSGGDPAHRGRGAGPEEHVELQVAAVVEVRPLGMGDRVCLDTCSNMGVGEGMLVGNSSAALFLVHAESIGNPYVAPRPFRVNAGPVHAYVRVPGGGTRYLADLRSGDEALLVDWHGQTRLTRTSAA